MATLDATLGGETANSYADKAFADAYSANQWWGDTWAAGGSVLEDSRRRRAAWAARRAALARAEPARLATEGEVRGMRNAS